MLTQEQIDLFDTFGFLHLRQVLTPEERQTITAAADATWAGELERNPQADDIGLSYFVEDHPALRPLLTDDRIYQPMVQLLGEDFIWSGSEGNRAVDPKIDDHHWHADRPGAPELDYLRIKIMIYLSPMRKEQGALRVIPGSHRLPLHAHLQPFQRAHSDVAPTFFGMCGADVPCHAVETDPGDVVIFTQNLFHSVYGKTGLRRYIALKFVERPTCNAHLASLQRWSPYTFAPAPSLLASGDPRIQRMVAGLIELGERAKNLETTS